MISERNDLKIYFYAKRTITDEMDSINANLRPMLALSGFLMVTFVLISASMKDWVRSKMVLSLFGIVSVVMATSTAFGILSYCQVPFFGINYATIFLMLGKSSEQDRDSAFVKKPTELTRSKYVRPGCFRLV